MKFIEQSQISNSTTMIS